MKKYETDILATIQEEIRKHLPAAIGDELVQRLKDLNDLEEENQALKQEALLQVDRIDHLQGQLSAEKEEALDLSNRYKDLNKRELDLGNDQKRLMLDELHLTERLLNREVELLKESRSEITNLVATIFKSPVVKTTVIRSGSTETGYVNLNETTETETR